ncbi:response regulator, partial [bacterium]
MLDCRWKSLIESRSGHNPKGKHLQLRVLLLEDSPLDADIITDWLQSGGLDCGVNRVQSREEFAAALKSGGVDVILSDYSLPSFDGMAALTLAQEMRPAIPFIFVSGFLGEDLAIESLKRGATDYVLKGRLERLVPSVLRAIREARQNTDRKKMETSLRLLSDASLVLSSLDYSTTLTRVAQLAVPHFADICIVDILQEDGVIARVAVADADESRNDITQRLLSYSPETESEHPAQTVIRNNQSQLLAELPPSFLEVNSQDGAHLETLQQLGIQSAMLVPLSTDGHSL